MQAAFLRWLVGILVFAMSGVVPSAAVPGAPPGDGDQAGTLYPAYQLEGGVRRWGYVNGSGNFVIAPQFDSAEEFGADGLAVVCKDGPCALIDRSGRVVLPFAPAYIATTLDGVRIRYADGAMQLLDTRGEVVFAAEWVSGSFGDGLTPFSRGGLYGYVRRDGSVAIEPQFTCANPFEGGRAVVRLQDQTYAVIDTSGQRLLELNHPRVTPAGEGILAYRECDTDQEGDACRWGYRSPAGDVDIKPRFLEAQPFADGLAVVVVGEDYATSRYGVIDKQGNAVIPAEYGLILYLGEGLYEVAQPFSDDGVPPTFKPHALFSAQGEQLTDFEYYDMVLTPLGVSVSDETATYFLDRTGRRVDSLPSVAGIGTMRAVGDLIAVQVDGELSYMTRSGDIVWQAPNTWPLPGGVTAADRKYREGRDLLIHYPELTGLPDAAVQRVINARLRTLFFDPAASQGDWAADMKKSTEVSFAVRQVGRVLVVEHNIYVYPLGAAHGMPFKHYYHFDLTTGTEYQLADLFRKGSAYPERLQELVRQQIAADPDLVFFDQNPAVRPDHPFTVDSDGLRIYWEPYEIAPYAAGFPTFEIPYADLEGMIDTEGAFWKALQSD